MQNPTWEQVDPKEALSPNQPLHVTLDRGGQLIEKTIVPEPTGVSQIGFSGWIPKQPAVTITDLEAGMPAEKAGLKVGDEITAVNGQPVPALEAMIETLKKTKDQPVQLTVLRDGKTQTFTVQPVLSDVTGTARKTLSRGHLEHSDESHYPALCAGLQTCPSNGTKGRRS